MAHMLLIDRHVTKNNFLGYFTTFGESNQHNSRISTLFRSYINNSSLDLFSTSFTFSKSPWPVYSLIESEGLIRPHQIGISLEKWFVGLHLIDARFIHGIEVFNLEGYPLE